MNNTLTATALALMVAGIANAAEPATVRPETSGQRLLTYTLSLDAEGTVLRVTPEARPADPAAAALAERVAGWRFQPAEVNGVPATAETSLRVVTEPAVTAGDPLNIVSVTTGPAPRRLSAPSYSVRDQRAGNTGTVVLKLDVGSDGAIHAAAVEDVVGRVSRDMAEAARESAMGWLFTPEQVDGRAVASTLLWPVCYLGAGSNATDCAWRGPEAQRFSSKTVLTLEPAVKLVTPLAFESR